MAGAGRLGSLMPRLGLSPLTQPRDFACVQSTENVPSLFLDGIGVKRSLAPLFFWCVGSHRTGVALSRSYRTESTPQQSLEMFQVDVFGFAEKARLCPRRQLIKILLNNFCESRLLTGAVNAATLPPVSTNIPASRYPESGGMERMPLLRRS